jgi:glycosyltransferase involved in cell wall biosynthesis
LLFPVDWPEPFELFMIEAMACGTPVLAVRCSVPEIVEQGVTETRAAYRLPPKQVSPRAARIECTEENETLRRRSAELGALTNRIRTIKYRIAPEQRDRRYEVLE